MRICFDPLCLPETEGDALSGIGCFQSTARVGSSLVIHVRVETPRTVRRVGAWGCGAARVGCLARGRMGGRGGRPHLGSDAGGVLSLGVAVRLAAAPHLLPQEAGH